MPISVQWTDHRRCCVVVTYSDLWSWSDFQKAALVTNDLVSSVPHPVAIIENTLDGSVLPSGNIIANGKNAITGFPDNTSLIVVVLNSSIIRTFLSIVTNMNPRGRGGIIKTSATLEEALALTREVCPRAG
ncbi:MAG: hypothetical protein LCI00_28935 [Chloroflexi bacterium]|nr:hypothetical protein [Chloroflexota bacterium]MCC6896755.1 hypothetical protein [Anaerolineae bacterium]